MRNNAAKSCGGVREIIHGMRHTSEYWAWNNMKQRCCNLNHPRYKDYGGRGIKVCDKWLDSFEAFFKDMGKKPGLEYTIERIDNDGDYTSDNCKWATQKEQHGNTRKNAQFKAVSPVNIVYISKNQKEFARLFHLNCAHINDCLNNRYKTHKGWTFIYL